MATIATLKDLVDALTETGLENNNLETIISNLKSLDKKALNKCAQEIQNLRAKLNVMIPVFSNSRINNSCINEFILMIKN